MFELQDLGAKEVKGIAEPVRAWVALRPSSVESRFQALHAGGLTELVAREEELEILLRRWAKAKTGEGQVVLEGGQGAAGANHTTVMRSATATAVNSHAIAANKAAIAERPL